MRIFEPVPVEEADLGRPDRLGAVHAQLAVQHHERGRPPVAHDELGRQVAAQAQVGDLHRSERLRGAPRPVELARDHAHAALAARQRHQRNLAVQDPLVPGRRLLVLRGQVHPELHHLEGAAAPRVLAAVEFLVDDARRRGHPLNVTRTDRAAAARRVAVLDFALVHDRHRLEAAVRVRADSAALARGLERRGARVVEQQERAQHRPEVRVGEQRPHRKAVADPVPARAALDGAQLLHGPP